MRFGSVCSGIEAASVAWHPLGWRAAWLSEIEPFPSAVLAHHYPDVPNLGDMTTLPERILSGEVEAPDLFCGGTPCQAFSVAGLRNSLDDARGNLSLTFVGIANAIDHVRVARSDAPAIIFWENVPGVLSTKDNAFGCFLAGLAGEDNPLEPPRGKWTNAGYVLGPKRAVAWRLLNAQYFGVAQRRKRVFVVASARDDFDPAAVLFEFDGVRRDSAPSRETGQRVAPCVTNGPSFSRTGNERVETEAMVVQPVIVHGTQDPCVPDIAFTQGRNNGGENVLVQQVVGALACNTGPNGHDAGNFACNQAVDAGHVLPVAQPMPINTMVALRHEALGRGTGFGIGEAGDPAYTLTKGHSHAVAQPIPFDTTQITSPANYSKPQAGDPCHPLAAGAHAPAVMQPIGIFQDSEYGVQQYDSAGTLRAGRIPEHQMAIQPPTMQVRRLTPVECERLQGFPDNYTNIPWRKKPESPDGPRYKALGNSWAVPNVRWIGKRIQGALNALP